MGTKNQQSSGTSSGTATTTLSPQVQAAYNSLLGQLGGVSSGTNAATGAATAGLGQLASTPNANYTAAGATLGNATTPAYASIGNYLSPYLSGALQTQIASQNQQNAQQQQQVIGNAAAQGALGGNRVGVAQGQLAGQQAIANNAANSALINSAYQQAENSAISGQQNQIAAGSAQSNLGNAQNASTLSDLLGQLSGGTSQFSNLGTLGNLAAGLSNSGQTISTQGTTSQTQPAGNWLSSLVGAGLGIAGLFNKGGVVPHYDAGGSIGNSAALMSALNGTLQAATPHNDNQANDNSTSPFGNLASPAQMKAGASNIQGWISPILAGLSSGGSVRGYDDGGFVPPPPAYMSALLDQITNAPDTPSIAAPPALPAPSSDDSAPPIQPMLPENGFSGLSDQIVNAPASIQPSLIGNSGIVLPASYGNSVDHVAAAGPAAMVDATQPARYSLANPSMQILPPDVTLQSRAIARDQQMARQGFPVQGLGALAAADEQAYGLPPGYLSRTAQIESGGNPTASNPSGATGLFQFMPSTARQYGLTNPDDPVASTNAAAKLAADNAGVLANGLGRPPTAAELYLAHQQGAGGALGLLRNPNAPAASIIGAGAVIQNGGTPDMTAGQFASMWENKFGAGDNGARGLVPNAVTPSGAPAGGVRGGLGVTPAGGYGVPDSNAGYATNLSQVIQSLQAGKGLNLSPDARMGLLSAAAGMMSGTSPFALANIGTGIQQGLKTWQDQQAVERQNALANSAIGAQQGELGISGQQLQLTAAQTRAQVAQELAQANLTNVQGSAARYVRMPTGAGLVVYDVTQPDVTPRVIPWNQVKPEDMQGLGAGAPPASGTLPPSGIPAAGGVLTGTSAAADILPSPATPVPAQSIDPRQMNPNADVQSQAVKVSTDALSNAYKDMQGAQTANGQLQELRNDLSTLSGAGGFLTPGAGFQDRLRWANRANTALSAINVAPLFGPAAVAAGEDAQKQTTRLGDALAASMGSREAAQIVMASVGATPGASQTPAGAAHIMAGLEAMNQRKIDYYTMAQKWAQQNNGALGNYDAWFNQHYPPALYAISSYVPEGAMAALRQNPRLANAFDQKYGNGQRISQYVLGSE